MDIKECPTYFRGGISPADLLYLEQVFGEKLLSKKDHCFRFNIDDGVWELYTVKEYGKCIAKLTAKDGWVVQE